MDDALLQRTDDLLDEERSAWEIDFLESLQSQVKAGKELTHRQMDKLEEIEERKQ